MCKEKTDVCACCKPARVFPSSSAQVDIGHAFVHAARPRNPNAMGIHAKCFHHMVTWEAQSPSDKDVKTLGGVDPRKEALLALQHLDP